MSEVAPSNERYPNPCMERLLGSLAALHEAGYLPDEVRVGDLVGVRTPDGREVALPEAYPANVSTEGHLAFDGYQLPLAMRYVLERVRAAEPGTLRVDVYNGTGTGIFGPVVTGLGSALAAQHSQPEGPRTMLTRVWERQAEVALRGDPAGTPTTPRQIAVIVDDHPPDTFTADILRKVTNVPEGEALAQVVTVGLPLDGEAGIQPAIPGRAIVRPPAPEDRQHILESCAEIARKAEQGGEPPALSKVLPERPPSELMLGSSIDGLKVPVGVRPNGELAYVTLRGANSHMYVLGTTGTGKTILLRLMGAAFAEEYGPDEVSLYVLDGKSAEHAPLAPGIGGEAGNPVVKVLGMNLERDPTFGLAIITDVQKQLAERADLFRQAGVTNYEEYRRQNPGAVLPRIVLVLDEMQVFLPKGPDGEETAGVLADIARRGRAWGVHLVLCTQVTSGIESLATVASSLLDQINVRVSGRVPTDRGREGIANLPPMTVVVSTATSPATTLRVPAAYEPVVSARRETVWDEAKARNEEPEKKLTPPRVFDGLAVPRWKGSEEREDLKPPESGSVPYVAVAAAMKLDETIAKFPLSRVSGRNLAVFSSDPKETGNILAVAADSLARQLNPKEDPFTIVYLSPEYEAEARKNADNLRAQGFQVRLVDPQAAPSFFADTHKTIEQPFPGTRPVFVYGANGGGLGMTKRLTQEIGDTEGYTMEVRMGRVDEGTVIGRNADGSTLTAPCDGQISMRGKTAYITPDQSGRDHLAAIAREGPDAGLHIVAHWPSSDTLQETLGTDRTSFVGYVALGVHGATLSNMTPGIYTASRRATAIPPGRALFYDQHQGANNPEVVVPFKAD